MPGPLDEAAPHSCAGFGVEWLRRAPRLWSPRCPPTACLGVRSSISVGFLLPLPVLLVDFLSALDLCSSCVPDMDSVSVVCVAMTFTHFRSLRGTF